MVTIDDVDMDEDQIIRIVETIPEGNLNYLCAGKVNFGDIIDSDILASAINSLESFLACSCYFDKEQT